MTPQTNEALEFLKRASYGQYRIVSSNDLSLFQIVEARANNLFYVDPDSHLGWALLPWELTTDKDVIRDQHKTNY